MIEINLNQQKLIGMDWNQPIKLIRMDSNQENLNQQKSIGMDLNH